MFTRSIVPKKIATCPVDQRTRLRICNTGRNYVLYVLPGGLLGKDKGLLKTWDFAFEPAELESGNYP